MKRVSTLFLAFSLSPVLFLHSSVDPSLGDLLQRSSSDTTISVIVTLKDRVDLDKLEESFSISRADFRNRHYRTITTLKNKATATQKDFIEFLKTSKKEGRVHDYKSFWIVNAVLIEADPDLILQFAARADVERISLNATITLDSPIKKSPAPPVKNGFEPNLGLIGADTIWRMGYSGKGVLVCTFDSGADPDHPSLSGKWRGRKGFPYSECWFDPYNYSNTPVDDDAAGSVTHGTGVLSVILGSSGRDTVGVAPGAQWIAANAFEANSGGSQVTSIGILLKCFEWAAEPDGDPSTVDDVPRVINCSWGTNLGNGGGVCDDELYDAIDAVEAIGSAVIFSAGNTGTYGAYSIASPASRTTSAVNAFAVGAVQDNLEIASYSSRGPSTCDSSTVKPEVVAPGDDIRMARGTNVGGGYHYLSGTSFSTPHAAGAAALLLDINPQLTSKEVKSAILNSARDLGILGEDNTYGMGVIDLPAAVSLVGSPSGPSISIVDIDYTDGQDNSPDPGETLDVVLKLRNGGTSASDLLASLSTDHPRVSVTQASSYFGELAGRTEADNGFDPFTITVGEGVPEGENVKFSLTLSWSGGIDTLSFHVAVGKAPIGASGEHDAGNVTFTITNFGQYGYYNGAKKIGRGFRFPKEGTNWLYHGGFLAGTSATQVSDGVEGGQSDWWVLPGGDLIFKNDGEVADQEGYAAYHDGGANNSLGLHILQRSLAFSDNNNDDFIILVYFVINSNSQDRLENLYTGLYFDWDLNRTSYDQNFADWIPDTLGYMYSEQFDEYLGLSILSHRPTSYRAIENEIYIYNGVAESDKFRFMSEGFELTRGDTLGDWSHMISAGPFSLEPHDTVTVAFAVLGGEDFNDLRENTRAAQVKYEEIKGLLPLMVIPPSPPEVIFGSSLQQNYPNPFAPKIHDNMVITFIVRPDSEQDTRESLPVSLKVYDLRGRLVKCLINPDTPMELGEHTVEWNGIGDQKNPLRSGMYLYQLEVGGQKVTRKMILLR
jgi:bacillopeptidase F